MLQRTLTKNSRSVLWALLLLIALVIAPWEPARAYEPIVADPSREDYPAEGTFSVVISGGSSELGAEGEWTVYETIPGFFIYDMSDAEWDGLTNISFPDGRSINLSSNTLSGWQQGDDARYKLRYGYTSEEITEDSIVPLVTFSGITEAEKQWLSTQKIAYHPEKEILYVLGVRAAYLSENEGACPYAQDGSPATNLFCYVKVEQGQPRPELGPHTTINIWGGSSKIGVQDEEGVSTFFANPREWHKLTTTSGYEFRKLSTAKYLEGCGNECDAGYILEFDDGLRINLFKARNLVWWNNDWKYEIGQRNPTLYGIYHCMASGDDCSTFEAADKGVGTSLWRYNDLGANEDWIMQKTIIFRPNEYYVQGGKRYIYTERVFLLDTIVYKHLNFHNPGYLEWPFNVPVYVEDRDDPESNDFYVYFSLGGPPSGGASNSDTDTETPVVCTNEDAENDENCVYNESDYLYSPDNSGEEAVGPTYEKKCIKIVPTFDEDGNLIGNEQVEEDCPEDGGGLAVGELPKREYPPLDDAPEGTMNILNLLGKKLFTPPTPEGEPEE